MLKWIGIGTGRCGTQSLARICRARHETIHPPWNIVSDQGWKDELEGFCWRSTSGEVNHKLVNKVSLVRATVRKVSSRGPTFADYGERRAAVGRLPVVCLHRGMRSTVRSFLELCGGSSRCHPSGAKQLGPKVSRSYPQFAHTKDHAEAWEHYWYVCEEFMRAVEPPVFHMSMEELNSDLVLRQLFDFLNLPDFLIPPPDKRKVDGVAKMGAKAHVLKPYL